MSSKLVRRLKKAYHANRIPVDPQTETLLESLTDACLLATARHWEKAAADALAEAHALTIRECKTILESVQGSPPCGSQRGRRVDAQSRTYHGNLPSE